MKAIDTIDPEFRKKIDMLLMGAEIATGIKWVVYCGRRTMAEQKFLYEQAHDGIDNDHDGKIDESDEHVTNAPPGYSAHNYGLAVDLVPKSGNNLWWNAPDKIWRGMADTAVKLGLTSGFYFKSIHDAPHVEDPRWKDLRIEWKEGRLKLK